MIPSMNRYMVSGRVPGEEPLPYVKTGRQTVIAGIVMACHAALIIVPMIFLAISEMIKPPVYVMRLPTVDSVPNENPDKPSIILPVFPLFHIECKGKKEKLCFDLLLSTC